MAFREQKMAALAGVPLYGIFAPPDYIGLPRRINLSHHDLTGIVSATESAYSGHRKRTNLPSDPRDIYMYAGALDEPGFHQWASWDATIDQAKILPNPPQQRGDIIARVQHVNYQAPNYLNGSKSSFGMYPSLPIEDPVNSYGSTLGYPFPPDSRVAPIHFSSS